MDKEMVLFWFICMTTTVLLTTVVAGCIAHTNAKRLDYCLAVKASPSECRVLEGAR